MNFEARGRAPCVSLVHDNSLEDWQSAVLLEQKGGPRGRTYGCLKLAGRKRMSRACLCLEAGSSVIKIKYYFLP